MEEPPVPRLRAAKDTIKIQPVELLTSWRLSVKFSWPQLLKHDSSLVAVFSGIGSPRARAPRTRHSCLCFRSSSSHNPARLASRRSLVRLRSTGIGKENARCMAKRMSTLCRRKEIMKEPYFLWIIMEHAVVFRIAHVGYQRPCWISFLVVWKAMSSMGSFRQWAIHFLFRSCQMQSSAPPCTRSIGSDITATTRKCLSSAPCNPISVFIGLEGRWVLRVALPPLIHYIYASTSPCSPAPML